MKKSRVIRAKIIISFLVTFPHLNRLTIRERMKKISFRNDILPLKNELYRLALRITLNPAEAEDIVQETMIKVWNRRDQWDEIESIEAFCLTICRNLALDKMHKMENQNSYNMALTQNRVKYLSGQDPVWSDEQIAEYKFVSEGGRYADDDIRRYKYFNTNWFEELYRESAPVYKTNLQLSGGNDIARYYGTCVPTSILT